MECNFEQVTKALLHKRRFLIVNATQRIADLTALQNEIMDTYDEVKLKEINEILEKAYRVLHYSQRGRDD